MARPSFSLALAASAFECVRVTDLAGVDLSRYRFDYDLTFCALMMDFDGSLHHTFGGRTAEDPQSHLSIPAFVRALRISAEEHRNCRKAEGRPAESVRPWTVEDLPPLARRIARGERPDCIHCHSVHDWQVQSAMEDGTWNRERAWVYPDPIEIGVRLDPVEQNVAIEVIPDSPAAQAGIVAGDRIVEVEGIPVATFGDFARGLDSARGRSIRLRVRSADVPPASGRNPAAAAGPMAFEGRAVTLSLPDGWRTPDPATFAWRPMKWNLEPAPGFGGLRLPPEELRALGLDPDRFAFRIEYLVTWGPRAYTGRNAARAGLRTGDVVLSVAGKEDFDSVDHFHAWYRLTRRPGERVEVIILRRGRTLSVDLPVRASRGEATGG